MCEKFFVLYQFSYDGVCALEAKERRDLLPSRKRGRDEESGGKNEITDKVLTPAIDIYQPVCGSRDHRYGLSATDSGLSHPRKRKPHFDWLWDAQKLATNSKEHTGRPTVRAAALLMCC